MIICKHKVLVSSNASDHFVLKNGALKIVVEGGRITSLFDIEEESVYLFAHMIIQKLTTSKDENSLQPERLVD